jgi:predicted dehydrogenase
MTREHARVYAATPGVTLAGIASRTRSRAEAVAAEFGIATVSDSIGELHRRVQPDLVVVAVPILSVPEVCRELFAYPWTSLIEKPVGVDLETAEVIAADAADRGSRAYVALNRRYYGATRTVTEALAGDAGRRIIHVFDQEDQLAARKAGQPERVVQNWMYANAIHVADYLRVFGRGDVSAVRHISRWNPESPVYVAAHVEFSSGDTGVYHAVWNGPGPWAVTVTTPAVRWELRPLEAASVQHYPSRKVEQLPIDPFDTLYKPGLFRQAADAVRAAQGEPTSLPTLIDAVESMRLIRQIYE